MMAAIVLLTGCAPDRHPAYPSGFDPNSSDGSPRGWARIAAAPLTARHDALAVPLGTRYLVIGGQRTAPCDHKQSCPDHNGAVDGAMYDPSTDTWQTIAPAPLPITATTQDQWAVLNGDLYMLAAAKRITHLLRYDAATNTWTQLPAPSTAGAITAGSSSLYWTARTNNGRQSAVASLTPPSHHWTPAPADPLGPSQNRHIVDGDGDILLAGETSSSGRTPHVEWTALYSATRGWSIPARIPAQSSDFTLIRATLVFAQTVSGRSGTPGVLDPATKRFMPLTPSIVSPTPHLVLDVDVTVGDGLLHDGTTIDTDDGFARELAEFPGDARTAAAGAGSTTGTTVFVWGGANRSGHDLTDGYLLYR